MCGKTVHKLWKNTFVVPVDGVAPSFRVYESLVLLLNYTGVFSL